MDNYNRDKFVINRKNKEIKVPLPIRSTNRLPRKDRDKSLLEKHIKQQKKERP